MNKKHGTFIITTAAERKKVRALAMISRLIIIQRVEQWNDGVFVSSRDWTPADGDGSSLRVAAQKLLAKWDADAVLYSEINYDSQCHRKYDSNSNSCSNSNNRPNRDWQTSLKWPVEQL